MLARALRLRPGSWLALAAAILMAYAVPAAAERDKYSGAPLPPESKRRIPSPLTDRFYVRGTLLSAHLTTTLRVDSSAGVPGTTVSAENDLRLRSHVKQGEMEVVFRLRERNRVRLNYYESDRSATAPLNRPINFGDQAFLVNDLATTSLDWRMFALTYSRSVLQRDRFELGVGLGVYLVQGEARGQVPARELSQEVSGVAAFPTPELDGTWRISSRFAFTARGQYLHATVNNFSGSLGDYHADFQYRWRPNFALGLGYSSLKVSLDVKGGSFPGFLALNVRGPEAFFRVSY